MDDTIKDPTEKLNKLKIEHEVLEVMEITECAFLSDPAIFAKGNLKTQEKIKKISTIRTNVLAIEIKLARD